MAPGPSMATHVPPASGPSHHDAPSSGDFASARVVEGDWEPVRTWSRRVSSPQRLRDELELIHTKITQHREIIDFIHARGMSPANHYYRDLDLLHAEYDQLSQTLLESREAFASSRRRGSPDVASPAAAPRPSSTSRFFVTHGASPVTSAWPFLIWRSTIRFSRSSSSTRRLKRSFSSKWNFRRSLTQAIRR